MAKNDPYISIGMGMDISGLQTALKTAKSEMSLAQSEFSAATAGLDAWDKSIDGLNAKLESLAKKIKAQETVVQAYRNELERVNKQYGENSTKSQEVQTKLNNAQATLTKMTKEYDGYNAALHDLTESLDAAGDEAVETAGDMTKVGKSLGDVDSSSSSLVSGGLEKLKNKLIDVAKNGVFQLINAFKQFVKQTIQVGMDFTETMSKVQATSRASEDEMKMLEETARKFGATTTFSATQAAEALNYMALAGWKADESAEALGGILNLAAAAGMDLAEASDIVTDYLSAFNMKASESGRMADVLAYAQSNANTTVAQMAAAYKNAVPTLASSGQNLETVTSLLAVMSNAGLKGGEAGTALAAIMRDLTNKMSNGSIKIGKYNVKVADVKGNFLDLTKVLTNVGKAIRGMGTAEAADTLNDIFTVHSIKGVNLLLGQGMGAVSDFTEQLKNSGGTAQEMSDIMTDNLAGDKKALDSAIEDLQLRLFDLLEGPLRGIMQFLTDAIPVLIKWGEDLYNFFNGIYEALGPLWDALGAVMGYIGDTVGKAFSDMSDKFGRAKEGAGNIADAATSAYNGIKDAFKDAGKWASDTYDSITGAFDNAGQWFKDKFDASWNNLTQAFTDPKGWAEGIWEQISGGFGDVGKWFSTEFGNAWKNLKDAFPNVTGWAEGVWNNIKTAFTDPIGWAKGIASNIRTGLQSGWEQASSLLSGAWNSVKMAFGDAYSWAGGIANSIRNGIKSGWEYASSLLSGVWNSVKSAFTDAYTWAGGIAGTIRNGLQSGWEYASSLLTQAWQNVKSAFTDPIGWAKGIASSIRTGLSDGWTTISTTFGGIWDKIKGAFGNPAETFRSMFSGVYNAITGAFGGIKTFFEGIYNSIVGIFKPILQFFGIQVEDSGYEKQKKELEETIKREKSASSTAFRNYVSSYNAGNFSLANAEYGEWQRADKAEKEAERALSQLEAEHRADTVTNDISGIPNSISQAFKDIPSLITKPFEDAYKGIKSVFDGIGGWFQQNVIDPICEAFDIVPDEVVDGLALGLKQGATSSGLGTGISTLADAVSGGAKNALGIHSPSKVMRDEVGLMVGAGVAEGIRDSIRGVKAASEELAGAVPGRIGEPGIAGTGAGAVTYIQNITSPTPLTAGQIYRDTRSLIGRRGWLA